MRQVVINIENPSILPRLRKVHSAIDSISIARYPRHRSRMDNADKDIRKGRVYKAANVDDMFKQILGN
ncbi:MAG: response regulator [Bacteroidales bacterium]|nr:response regulator [Bacteroidales bacterium]